MMRGRLNILLLPLACAAACLPVRAAPAPAAPALIAAQSDISFVSHQMGVPIDGRFRKFDAQVQFDPKAPQKAHFVIDVDITSVSLPTSDAMEEVVKPAWFNSKNFPAARFVSSAVRPTVKDHYEISGQLTIKGQTQDVVVPVTLAQSSGITTAAGEIVLHRLAFAIGDGEWKDTSVVADNVEVKFHLALTGIAPF